MPPFTNIENCVFGVKYLFHAEAGHSHSLYINRIEYGIFLQNKQTNQ